MSAEAEQCDKYCELGKVDGITCPDDVCDLELGETGKRPSELTESAGSAWYWELDREGDYVSLYWGPSDSDRNDDNYESILLDAHIPPHQMIGPVPGDNCPAEIQQQVWARVYAEWDSYIDEQHGKLNHE